MPELPEVETVRRGLEPVLTGASIAHADIRREGLRWPFPDKLAARLTGATITQLRRRSKYILADLDTGETLIIHLGMSGRMLISAPSDLSSMPGTFHHAHPAPEKHDHVILTTHSGVRVIFNDARRFGSMDLCATADIDAHRLLAGIGPEPLGNGFNAGTLAARFAGRKSPVKAALLDQGNVAGLGNIYVCEALWRAGIIPTRKAGKISPARIERLVGVIRDVLNDAIAAGGSSLKDYRQADGELGYFQHSFAVYDRDGEACRKSGCTGTIKRIVQSGRSTYYCPSCQR